MAIGGGVIYNTWRSSGAALNTSEISTATPTPFTTMPGSGAQEFAVAAMQEQVEAWRLSEASLIQKFSKIYKEYNLNYSLPLNQTTIEKLTETKTNFNIIDLSVGKLQIPNNHKTTYDFGYDGARFIPLVYQNNKYEVDPIVTPANRALLVSDDTFGNEPTKAIQQCKNLNITEITSTKLQLVQGVPGCESTEVKKQFYRCTSSVAKLLSPFYEQGMETNNPVKNEMNLAHFDKIVNLNIEKEKFEVLFSSSTKKEY
ncbi:hypothetical protein J6590_009908 [Homalodisca vitripennis]|nr:hypothetical protein J6590_009908 [Homalodisca vitripennis]